MKQPIDRGDKYRKTITVGKDGKSDLYDVLNSFGVTCSARQHAIKKLMMAGSRGSKDALTDLQEAGRSVERAIELLGEKK